MRRIVCVGNRFVREDNLGPAVFERLQAAGHPADVDVVDGGLRGLDLLPCFENVDRVVVVDSLRGFGRPGEVVVLRTNEVAKAAERAYDHAAGLTYLINALPALVSPTPEVFFVGVEVPFDETASRRVADVAVELCRRDSRIKTIAVDTAWSTP
jgi:hydrogenase maturation protease